MTKKTANGTCNVIMINVCRTGIQLNRLFANAASSTLLIPSSFILLGCYSVQLVKVVGSFLFW